VRPDADADRDSGLSAAYCLGRNAGGIQAALLGLATVGTVSGLVRPSRTSRSGDHASLDSQLVGAFMLALTESVVEGAAPAIYEDFPYVGNRTDGSDTCAGGEPGARIRTPAF
jgi:hypothetical protein